MPKRKRSKRIARSLLACVGLAVVVPIAATPDVNARQRFSASPPAVHSRGVGMPTPAFRGVVRKSPILPRISHPASRRAAGFPVRDHRHRRRRVFQCAPMTGVNIQQLLAPYPGYGFNFEHLSAINGDLAIKAAIDPATQLQLQELEQFGCTEAPTSGYLLGDGEYVVPDETAEEPEQPDQATAQPQIIVVQEQPSPAPAEASTAAQSQAPPVLDEAQFELVMADGRYLDAVAFTRDEDKIVYITPEGSRQTTALSDLDIDATVRVNEAHGTPIQLSF